MRPPEKLAAFWFGVFRVKMHEKDKRNLRSWHLRLRLARSIHLRRINMFRTKYLTLVFTALLFTSAAIAQNAPVRGEVKVKKADGTEAPVAGALVEAFRSDVDKGKMPDAKTNKRGEFTFVGFPLGQRYVLSVSGPGISPMIQPNIRAGMENVVIIVSEGDGRQLTEAEARAAAKNEAPAAASGGESEEQKKARAELEKKNAEIMAKNKKAEDANKVVNTALKAGEAAFVAKNYDLAITEFDKGVEADPDFAGSAPPLLNYKGVALQRRAVATNNAAADAAARAAVAGKVKADLDSAVVTFNRGLEVLKTDGPASGVEPARLNLTKTQLLSNLLETHGIAARLAPDPTRDAAAGAVLDQYIAAEPDGAKRMPSIVAFANNMNSAGELKLATAGFRKVLEVDPNNLDALAGIGLALYSEGSMTAPPNKEILQEGLNFMQKFVDTAPDTHKLKESTKAIIEELKNEQKLAPQKTAAPKRRT